MRGGGGFNISLAQEGARLHSLVKIPLLKAGLLDPYPP